MQIFPHNLASPLHSADQDLHLCLINSEVIFILALRLSPVDGAQPGLGLFLSDMGLYMSWLPKLLLQ